jgi:hypothetical protein
MVNQISLGELRTYSIKNETFEQQERNRKITILEAEIMSINDTINRKDFGIYGERGTYFTFDRIKLELIDILMKKYYENEAQYKEYNKRINKLNDYIKELNDFKNYDIEMKNDKFIKDYDLVLSSLQNQLNHYLEIINYLEFICEDTRKKWDQNIPDNYYKEK